MSALSLLGKALHLVDHEATTISSGSRLADLYE